MDLILYSINPSTPLIHLRTLTTLLAVLYVFHYYNLETSFIRLNLIFQDSLKWQIGYTAIYVSSSPEMDRLSLSLQVVDIFSAQYVTKQVIDILYFKWFIILYSIVITLYIWDCQKLFEANSCQQKFSPKERYPYNLHEMNDFIDQMSLYLNIYISIFISLQLCVYIDTGQGEKCYLCKVPCSSISLTAKVIINFDFRANTYAIILSICNMIVFSSFKVFLFISNNLNWRSGN